MGIQKTPYQKTYELQAGSQEFTVDFKGCDRQFDWFEMSLRSQLQHGMRSKNGKKNRAIEHIGCVQRNKYDEI